MQLPRRALSLEKPFLCLTTLVMKKRAGVTAGHHGVAGYDDIPLSERHTPSQNLVEDMRSGCGKIQASLVPGPD